MRRMRGDGEVSARENVFNGESESFSWPICTREFPHQEVGIEQKDYETDLDDCSPNRGQSSSLCTVGIHSAGLSILRQ